MLQQKTLHEVWVSRRGRINIKKVFPNLHPEAKDILGETIFSHNLMDMVVLAKESDEIQLEVANLLATGKSNTFKRAMQLARCKLLGFNWDEEKAQLKERIGQTCPS